VEARPFAVVDPARALTRASAAAAAAPGDTTHINTRATLEATAASKGQHAGHSGCLGSRASSATSLRGVPSMETVAIYSGVDGGQHTRATRAAETWGCASSDGPGRPRRLPDPREPHAVQETEAAAVERGVGARPLVRSGNEADDSLLVAQEHARMRTCRRRWFTEHVRPWDARRGSLDVRRTTEKDFAAAEREGAPSHQRRGRGTGSPGRGQTDPGVDIFILVSDADALVLARPDRPRAAHVPVQKGPRDPTSVALATAACAALAAREEDLPMPQRRPPSNASLAADHGDQKEDDEEEAPPSSGPAGSSRRPDHFPSRAARPSRNVGGSRSGLGRSAPLQTGSGPSSITIPAEWEGAKSLKEKLVLRAAILHAVRDHVRH